MASPPQAAQVTPLASQQTSRRQTRDLPQQQQQQKNDAQAGPSAKELHQRGRKEGRLCDGRGRAGQDKTTLDF
jgi:hypothetical protein